MLIAILLMHTTVYFRMHHSNNNNIWRNVLLIALVAQLCDMTAIAVDGIGVSGGFVFVTGYVLRGLVFVLVTALASNLALFIEYSIGSRSEAFFRLKRLLYGIITACFIAVIGFAPFGANGIYYLNSANEYLRGTFYTLGILFMAAPILIITYRIFFIYFNKINQLIKSNKRISLLLVLLIVSLSSITVIEGMVAEEIEVTFPIISLMFTSVHLMLMSTSTSIDHLTGLQNILGVDVYFDELPKVSDFYIAALFFDLDKFKEVNDVHGHKMGDIILQDFSRILISEVKNKDLAARVGGDEFLLVVQADHIKAVDRLIETIEKRVEEYNNKHEINIYFSCGRGICEPNTKISKKILIDKADEQMYVVKEEHHKKLGVKR
jgi:diguanylate cyclase (GGDEF)-like protein